MKYRTAYDILALVVKEISLEPCSSSAVFYKLKSSWTVVEKGLDTAMRNQLVSQQGNKYQITQRGLEYLETWQKLQTYLKEAPP